MDVFVAGVEQGLKLLVPLRGEQNGNDLEGAFQEPADHLFTFGDKDTLLLMLNGASHGAIRRQVGILKGGDRLDMKH